MNNSPKKPLSPESPEDSNTSSAAHEGPIAFRRFQTLASALVRVSPLEIPKKRKAKPRRSAKT